MHTPLVSVVIPFYNRAEVLPRAVESALAQSHPRTEILLSDDGSTDGATDAAAAYARQHANVIHLRADVNRGSAAARNMAINAAKGDYIAFLDSDDLWYPKKLERQLTAFAAADTSRAVCQCGCRIVKSGLRSDTVEWRPDKKWEAEPFEALIKEDMSFQTSGLIVGRKALQSVGPFVERMRRNQDVELMLRLLARSGYIAIDEVLFEFHLEVRVGHYEAFHSVVAEFDAHTALISERLGPEAARRFRASRRRIVTEAALREGRWRQGLDAISERLDILPYLTPSDVLKLAKAAYVGIRGGGL